MAIATPNLSQVKITQSLKPATEAQLDALDAVIIWLPESGLQKRWPDFPHGQRLRKLLSDGAEALAPARADLPNGRGTAVIVASVKKDASAFELLTLARKCVAKVKERRPKSLGVLLPAHADSEQGRLAEALVAAVAASGFEPPSFKRKPEPHHAIAQLTLFAGAQRLDFRRTLAAAEGNALARWLTMLPANHLTPTHYLAYAQQLARKHGWQVEFLGTKRLKTLGAGAFLAVCQGSASDDAGILRLSYRPRAGKSKTKPSTKARAQAKSGAVALVGKGICYDTGGVNLKSAKSMNGMHGDMQGSAVALGTLLALTRLEVAFPVEISLALARNEIGPGAYTPNEVIRAANGVHIEIVHTDAEGRMVLADTLALAAARKPKILIDYATLTGSCITALGTRYSGAFCNRPSLATAVAAAGQHSGERVWPMPMDADYDEELESKVADVKQCLLESDADHILAARFLSRFVPDEIPWVHVDLASAEHKEGLAHVPTAVTGFGVRFTLDLLLDQRAP